MKKCLIISTSKEFSQEYADKLKTAMNVTWKQQDTMPEKELIDILSADKWDILAISPDPFGWVISKSVYSSLGIIKNICLPTTSYEFLDVAKLKDMGVALSNIPHYSTNAVAEQALFMMMGLLRRLPEQIKTGFENKYSDENLAGEFQGKTAGIIGLGEIGKKIAELLSGLGMSVIYWSLNSRSEKFVYKNLDEVLSTSDFIFPCYKIKDETKMFLNKKRLTLLKRSAYLVNIAGEDAWDTEEVLKMVSQKIIAGAAFETIARKQSDIKGNVLMLPRLGWYTKETQIRAFQVWYDNILSCVEGKPKNLV